MHEGRSKFLIGLTTLILLFLFLSVYREHIIPAHANREQRLWLLTGDEPCYLLAGAAFADGDGLDLGPAHRRGEHLRFYDRDIIGPGQYTWTHFFGDGVGSFTSSNWWGAKQIKQHLPGFPWLIAPLAHGQQYRWSVALAESLLVVLLAAVLLWLARALPLLWFSAVALAVLCFLAGAPIGYYTTQVFPETCAGVCLALALLGLDTRKDWSRILGGVLLMAALWLTPRAMAGVCLAAGLLAWNAVRRRAWAEVMVCVIGLGLFFAYNLFVWNRLLPASLETGMKGNAVLVGLGLLITGGLIWLWRPRPRVVIGGSLLVLLALVGYVLYVRYAAFIVGQNPPSLAKLDGLFRNVLIIFFANDVGLLFLNPAIWLGIVAAVWLAFFKRDEFFWLWIALFVGVVMSVAVTPEWRGGTCPAGRYGTVPAYLLLLPLIRVFTCAPDAWRRRILTTLVVLGLGGLTMGWFMAQAPNFWYRDYHPLFGYKSLQPYYDWLPPSDPARFGLKRYSLYWLLIFCATLGFYDGGRWLKVGWLKLIGRTSK